MKLKPCTERSELLYRMHLLSKEISHVFEQQTNRSFTKVEILFHIRQTPGQSQNKLKENLYIDSASITRHLKRMEEQGLITREKNDENKRYTYLFLTATGEAELASLLAEKENFQNEALAGFSEEEVALWLKSVTKMMNNIEKMEEK
ncbi:MarR family winged helix-turn-helix transcriptional regulator [Listeria ivanovii]|uniref:Putative transcription regulator MarR family n=1 Tax=Listeria ivanovii (strain ATCC BAA-678 / PAM 55) TaxID=881621 RepID=G2ZCE6_LISIP|nr:MarR family transcriptional regulator [Listeria ivanovii]AIS64586.1 MarR family transcriptional regulator [Listeria ivanovii subsp. ivanovii]MBC1758743.1 MarR family transcriptional regulator [Listeria ivanovii]MBK3913601.1 MarR family transcriptional regulator [Listeria ivanovii subsp. ivanovii]MBK3920281.1 MarR family transcriptional regulator [Listeria ivanovii subsp. ivanovii]MBK3925891.1 MarR family transcriptional regulator [Listeria ivanovii subsp. ivanovii]